MSQTITVPFWLFVLIVLFATVTFASHFLFPSVRWYFRRRLERAVERLNKRLTRPIEPFKLARRHDMIQRLIYDPAVTSAIVDFAKRNGVREDVAFQMARKYAREIVPSFSAFAYFSFGARLARWLARSLYNVKTGLNNDAILEGIEKDATVIFIMNHRSNMDYVLVTTLAAKASALSYAVGEWARVWPLSRLIKSMGAYFIRRRSRGGLYQTVLARYVQMATAGGVTQAIFPEGGLSLNGQLMPPKLGLLSFVVDGFQQDGRDVVFVPVAINYDRVLEDRVLIAAAERGDRKFPAKMSVIIGFVFRMVWQRLRGRFKGFGTAAVIFGDPLKLSERGDAPDLRELGQELMKRIADEMPFLFVPILSRVMLNASRPLDRDEMMDAVRASITDSTAPAPLVSQDAFPGVLTRARNAIEQRGMIRKSGNAWEMVEAERALLAFYANSVAHFYQNDAAVAK